MKSTNLIAITLVLFAVLGCKFLGQKQPAASEPQRTTITKEVMTDRLSKKGVKVAPKRDPSKPNQNDLFIKFDGSDTRFSLNNKTFEPFTALLGKLLEIRRNREENGLFAEGTNDVYAKLTLVADPKAVEDYNLTRVSVEDFEKLVDDLQKEGFTQFELSFEEIGFVKDSKPPGGTENKTPTEKPGSIGTISGGVVNGKASNLVQPEYPAAARAVRASGAVNVQVLIDEKGDVVSAFAVSGHPLLRAAAIKAAKESKFVPTLLSGKPVKVNGVVVYNFPQP